MAQHGIIKDGAFRPVSRGIATAVATAEGHSVLAGGKRVQVATRDEDGTVKVIGTVRGRLRGASNVIGGKSIV